MRVIDRTPPRSRAWPRTRWSIVTHLDTEDSAEQAAAWDYLVTRYRAPMEVFVRHLLVRHTGRSLPGEASEVVQSFLAKGFEKRWLSRADRSRGCFRTFVMTLLRHHLGHRIEHDMAQKRRPPDGVAPLSDDQVPVDARRPTADALGAFDECWVETAVNEAMKQLQEKNERYHIVIDDLIRNDGRASSDLHDRVGLRRQQLPVLVNRARAKIKDLLIEQLQGTVGDEPALLSEWQALQRYLP